jgi:MFS family permease
MQLLAPEILADARSLSAGVSVTGIILGMALWLLGWRGHRFWIVLGVTVGAGIFGLLSGPEYGTQPLVAGLLLAIAAGTLALALVRVVVFAACGFASWVVVHAMLPAWNEPLVCFLLGGLIGLLLFRFWTMVLTSGAGAVLMTYCGLSLADRLGKVDAVGLAERQAILLNGTCAGLAFVGLTFQFLLERRLNRKPDADEEQYGRRPPYPLGVEQPRKGWWNRTQRGYRQAG